MLNNLFKKLLGGENQTRNQVLNRPQSQVPYAPQKPQEDAGLVRGPQGLHPMNADIANFRNRPMQIGGQFAEDEFTPTDSLYNTGYYSPQVSQHGVFQQGNFEDPQRLRNYFNF